MNIWTVYSISKEKAKLYCNEKFTKYRFNDRMVTILNIDINEEMNKIRNSTMFKGCVHRDLNCNGITSKAHSIQHSGVLDKISKNGKVYCINFGQFALYRHLKLQPVGINTASIFTGLCNYHDSKIFEPIENNHIYEMGNREQNYLFAYRAFALSYYERHSTYEFKKKCLELKKGANIDQLKQSIDVYKKHLSIIEKLRISMNTNLDNKRFNKLQTETIIWPHNYGIAATSMFFIIKDREGNNVNSVFGDISPFFFTILPQNSKTYVLLSYLTRSKTKYQFLREQIVEADSSTQKMLISNILVAYVENFFISPDTWDSLPQETKTMFLKIYQSTLGGNKPRIGYFSNFNLFI